MNLPNPAIVANAAVRRMPRLVLVLFCLAYLVPGFVGRNAWKGADIASLGWMASLAEGSADWFHPSLAGIQPEYPSLLPYWLGAIALQWCPPWLPADFAVRLPFALLLLLTMLTTWFASYYLARNPRAQPVAFAFGGEPPPAAYASAMADGALLALIASLGLAQLAHETTPALAQIGFSGLLLFSLAALPWQPYRAQIGAWLALLGLTLCGAPAMALLFAVGGVVSLWLDTTDRAGQTPDAVQRQTGAVLLGATLAAAIGWKFDLWRWKVVLPQAHWSDLEGYLELLIWFTWPAWPLAIWTAWRWRKQWFQAAPSRHLLLPLWFVGVTLCTTLMGSGSDRTLLLALPALATLAAFALPTLKRQVASLIDWFTLLFFSGCGLTIWVVWIAMVTGFPSEPSANVARLAPGFTAHFSFFAFAPAVLATLVWAWLVKWRVGRHRAAIWKSLVLPAGGAALCWLLLMTLWMPLLDFAQSYNRLVENSLASMSPAGCVEVQNLGAGKVAAFHFYGGVSLKPVDTEPQCPWLMAEPDAEGNPPAGIDMHRWTLLAAVRHPTDGNENLLLFKRH